MVFKGYRPAVKIDKDTMSVSIKGRRPADIEIPLIATSIISAILVLISIIEIFEGTSFGGIFITVPLFICISVFAFSDEIMFLKIKKSQRPMVNRLSDFIWRNNLYSLDKDGNMDYAIIVTYQIINSNLIISLSASGTKFSKDIQEKEVELQSLVPNFCFIDKRIFNDRTEYVFTKEKDNRIYVN